MSRQIYIAAAFAAITLIAPSALGQAFYLWNGSLTHQGVEVADVSRMPVSVRWRSASRARVTYEDKALRLRGDIVTEDSDDYLMAGVGKKVRLSRTKGWTITMLPGTWAPAVRGTARGVRVELPRYLPVRQGWISAGAPPAKSPPKRAAWSWDDAVSKEAASEHPVPDDFEKRFCATTIHKDKGSKDTWRLAACDGYDALVVERIEGNWARIKVYVEGFTVQGFVESSPCEKQECTARPLPSFGMGCGDGRAYGRQVVLPKGTTLYSSKSNLGGRGFAVVKGELTAIELQQDLLIGIGCSGGICEPLRRDDPALPPENAFLVEYQRGDVLVVFHGYLEIPFGDLVDVNPDCLYPGGCFGSCRTQFDSWPP